MIKNNIKNEVLEEKKIKDYVGRVLEKKVTYVLKTKDLKFFSNKNVDKYGFQVIGFG